MGAVCQAVCREVCQAACQKVAAAAAAGPTLRRSIKPQSASIVKLAPILGTVQLHQFTTTLLKILKHSALKPTAADPLGGQYAEITPLEPLSLQKWGGVLVSCYRAKRLRKRS